MFIFDNPAGKSANISLNSEINGGKTKIKNINTTNDITVTTSIKEKNLGIFNPFCILLVKLQTIFN